MRKKGIYISRLTPYLMILPAVIVLFFIVIYPMIFSFWVSLHKWYLGKPQFFPFVGLRNYYTVIFEDPVFKISLINTLILVSVCLSVEFGLGILLALLLNRDDIKGKRIFRSCLITPVVLTPVVAGVLWKFQFHPSYGIINYLLSFVGVKKIEWLADPRFALFSIMIVDMWQWTPFMFLVLYAGVISLPKEPLEAAKVDGASSWQLLRYIVMPLLVPIIVVVLLIRTMDIIKLFDIVYVLTRGGPGDTTEVLTLYNFRVGLNYFYMGKAAAISWIIAAMVILLAQLYLRISGTEFYKRRT
ncbi:MAG TPA: sugar ABC transporter permease [Candidatus Aerophobetes bacterium]|uniref:Sugar ABC transporter permease n=1 Tax=Aerophobetes bacterium TaxID=2030807 RepID=A0A7V5HYA0_UNCAE|nr:sugar ABC transporter permease [Candidatus Aerophobetes bacterium]